MDQSAKIVRNRLGCLPVDLLIENLFSREPVAFGPSSASNRLYMAEGVRTPEFVFPEDQPLPTNAIVGIGSHADVQRLVNGGLIFVGAGGLWSESVTLYTDDMHSICDLHSGQRINPQGGRIIIEDHVWLGFESMVMRTVRIGQTASLVLDPSYRETFRQIRFAQALQLE